MTLARDLVLSPFGGDARAILDAAVRAEDDGYDGVWTFDHVSSLAALRDPGAGASRDPFAMLGAIAARTERVRLGVLVANVHNRHPAQLALAVDTLSSLAPGRVVCGIGAGAGPGSPFAREDAALGRVPEPAAARRALLAEHVAALRAIWAGRDATGSVATHGLTGVVTRPAPPIVVGAGATATLALAADLADGVNIVSGLGPRLAEQVALVRARVSEREHPPGARRAPFEVSVFVSDRSPSDVGEDDVPGGVDRVTVLLRP
ncbi:LLM class flavin-dependent oxidoreductase [Miniimonas sp. S16]|uniref:LLM class flavin-dependent oxidoreductase n=1 Tax=Miniimonas sp. S16 TaxID=2171623 RepID=UPI000D5261B3|nr:LLM class flavin-dependent oxidoreductase [Miniimonas sp. S16]